MSKTQNLQFARGRYLPPHMNFQRGSEATRFNSAGQMEVVQGDNPRIDFDPFTGLCVGLLIEESRENLMDDSANIAGMQSFNLSTTSNAIKTLDGTSEGDHLQCSASTESEARVEFSGPNLSADTQYTISAFLKKGANSYYGLLAHNGGNGSGESGQKAVEWDLRTGWAKNIIGNVDDHSAVYMGNGWYRCSITYTALASDSSDIAKIHPSDGDGDILSSPGDDVYAWGWQIEEGGFPTSYIPTNGSTKTRKDESASLPIRRAWYNNLGFSFVIRASNVKTSGGGHLVSFSNADTFNLFPEELLSIRSNIPDVYARNSNNTVIDSTSFEDNDGMFGVAVGLDTYGIVRNGGILESGSGSFNWSNMTHIHFGGGSINCHIKEFRYMDTRLTDDELALLTIID